MDLNQVAVFIKVVQLGSFSQAARQLGMPNSTVSAKVSALEKHLGVTLLQRTTRKLHITAAGKAYFEKCLLGLEELRAAEMELASFHGDPQGLLRITAPVELGGAVLPAVIAEYTKMYPKVQVEVLLTGRRVELLTEGIDLALRVGHLKDSTLVAKKLGDVFFAPFASPSYLKKFGTPLHPRELRQHQCLHFSPLGFESWILTSHQGKMEIPVRGKIIANDLIMIQNFAVLGQGIALLPSYYCQTETKEGSLQRILPDWIANEVPVQFVYPSQKYVTPKLSRFIQLAAKQIQKRLNSSHN